MNVNRGKMTAAAVLAVTLLVVGGVTGYGLHRAGTVGQPFVEDGRLKVMASFCPEGRGRQDPGKGYGSGGNGAS
mgnify:CR=1 FL=1